MSIYGSRDAEAIFRRLRASGRARLPSGDPADRSPGRAFVESSSRRRLASDAGAMQRDISAALGMGGPTMGRRSLMTLPEGWGRGAAIPPEAEGMRRTANTSLSGGLGSISDAALAWPKLRDPFQQWREKAWWWIDDKNFDESLKKVREWCSVPEAPIWMADGTFKPIGEVVVGDEVMGWGWRKAAGGGWRRVMQPSTVLATNRREAPMIVEVETESGRTVRATDDHRWSNYYYSPAMWGEEPRKGRTQEYRPAQVGMTMHGIIDPVQPPTDPKQIAAAGYLAGIIDGEGHVDRATVVIGQSLTVNPEICARIEEALNILDIEYSVSDRDGVGSMGTGIRTWRVTDGRRGLVRLVNLLPWSVKVRKAWEYAKTRRVTGWKDKVVAIRELGPGEVVSMQTETGNYVSQGFGSSNCRLMYMTHPLIPSLIDIYSRFPLLDIEFVHEDKKVAQFFEDLFLNELDYQDFLYQMAREYWTVGEAFALGSWHEGIGAWDGDELLNPDDVQVARNRALRQYQFHVKVPESIRQLINTKEPREEWDTLMRDFPDVIAWAQSDYEIPVSEVLLKHVKFTVSPWSQHGVPMLLRVFRILMLEESLNAAQDAVADRLYAPLILARLGLDDVDEEGPWIPDPAELQALRDDLSLTMMSDFRLMVYHHGLQIESVFGRDQMPVFDRDYDRVDMKVLQSWGIGREMLEGGASGVPYASGALNRELLTQMLSTYQTMTRKFLRDRMEPVADRQGFVAFERRGDMRLPVMERALMRNDETGEEYVEERPKLAIPEVRFRTMNFRDENVERDFLFALEDRGVPVSARAKLTNVPIEFDEELDTKIQEKLDTVKAELEFRRRLFISLFTSEMTGDPLPVPMEYAEEYQMWLMRMQGIAQPIPGPDISQPPDAPNVAPYLGEQAAIEGEISEQEAANQRPEESDTMRAANLARVRKSAGMEPEPVEDSIEFKTARTFRRAEFSDSGALVLGVDPHIRKVTGVLAGMDVVGDESVSTSETQRWEKQGRVSFSGSTRPLIGEGVDDEEEAGVSGTGQSTEAGELGEPGAVR